MRIFQVVTLVWVYFSFSLFKAKYNVSEVGLCGYMYMKKMFLKCAIKGLKCNIYKCYVCLAKEVNILISMCNIVLHNDNK